MDLNLVLAVSTLSRLSLPLDIGEDTVTIRGTSITLTGISNDIYIESASLPSIGLEFRESGFNNDVFIHRIIQALYGELDIVTDVIIQGIYNTAKTVGMNVNNLFIENGTSKNNTIILPIGQSISLVVFNGASNENNIKSTMNIPLANDPLRYVNIIKSLS